MRWTPSFHSSDCTWRDPPPPPLQAPLACCRSLPSTPQHSRAPTGRHRTAHTLRPQSCAMPTRRTTRQRHQRPSVVWWSGWSSNPRCSPRHPHLGPTPPQPDKHLQRAGALLGGACLSGCASPVRPWDRAGVRMQSLRSTAGRSGTRSRMWPATTRPSTSKTPYSARPQPTSRAQSRRNNPGHTKTVETRRSPEPRWGFPILRWRRRYVDGIMAKSFLSPGLTKWAADRALASTPQGIVYPRLEVCVHTAVCGPESPSKLRARAAAPPPLACDRANECLPGFACRCCF